MIRKLFLVIVMNAFVAHAGHCQTMSMDECMAYAVEHAAEVGRQQCHLANATWEYRSSVASLFPSVSASVAGAANFGRSIDPETNNYTTVSTIGNQYGVSGSMPLFVGMRQVNAVRLAKTGKLLGMHQVEIARVQAAAAAMDAYIEALYYKEMTAIAQKQVDDASALLQKTEKLYTLGRKSAADVAEIKSQKANSDYMLAEQENKARLAMIQLRNVMNYPQTMPLLLTDINEITPSIIEAADADSLAAFAIEHNDRALAAKLQTRQSRIEYSMAKGAALPTLYLYGGYNTSYFTNIDHIAAYDSFWNQLKNNQGAYVQVGISIPLLSGLSRTADIARSRNSWNIARINEAETLKEIENEVATTLQELRGLAKQHIAANAKAEAARMAYDGMKAKYEKGLASAIDLQTTATLLLQAEAECLYTGLRYVARQRMMEYYGGKPLIRK